MAPTARPAIVIADGDVDPVQLKALVGLHASDGPRPWVIAADGAAGKALEAGVRPDIVIGDGDSLTPHERTRLGVEGIELRLATADKDESDTELCLLEALATGAREITLIGALGGERPEHAIANLLLLADERFDACRVWLLDGAARMTRIGTRLGAGAMTISGRPGDFVSLFPLGEVVEGVHTSGLRFPLATERLSVGPTRGLSNELLGDTAEVTTSSGRLLVVHTTTAPRGPALATTIRPGPGS